MAQKQSVQPGEPALAPYFTNLEQQQSVNRLGMWIFLVTEVMLFGGFFAAYAVYFFAYHHAFVEASRELDLLLSTINTVVLLTSSLTVALAVHSVQTDDQKKLVRYLLTTIGLGLIFLAIKGFEYYQKYLKGHIPGHNFHFEGPPQAEIFFSLYFATTGLHAFHMLIGLAILSYLAFQAWRGRYSSRNFDAIELSGLYWHFVDVAWVFIFPLYYLIDRS